MTGTIPTREKLVQIAQQLPASAQVLAQLGELLTDVNSGLEEIAQLLRRDLTLAARIIRISNSVAYGSSGGISSIEDAVNRVGFAEVYRLTGFAAAAQMADCNLKFYGIPATQIRDNTLVCAIAMEELAKFAGAEGRSTYTAGLMRNTGKLILDRLGRELLKPTDVFVGSDQGTLIAWEESRFGRHSDEVGAMVLDAWRFPNVITQPVRFHCHLPESDRNNLRIATMLNIAAGIAGSAGFGLPGEATNFELTAEKLRITGVNEEHIKDATENSVVAFNQIKAALDAN